MSLSGLSMSTLSMWCRFFQSRDVRFRVFSRPTTVSLLFWHRYHIAVLNLLQRIVQNYIRTRCRPQHARSWPQSFYSLQCTEKLNINFAVLLLSAWWRNVCLFHFLKHLKFHRCQRNSLHPWIYSNAYVQNTAAAMKLLKCKKSKVKWFYSAPESWPKSWPT